MIPISRPYITWSVKEIFREGNKALEENDTFRFENCVAELKERRGTGPAKEQLKNLLILEAELYDTEITTRFRENMDLEKPWPSAAWLLKLEKLTDKIKARTRGDHSVYLVCLWNCHGKEKHGIYVGMTGRSPKYRYQQHKRGKKAGRGWVRRYGTGLLWPMFIHMTNIDHDEAKQLEGDVFSLLKKGGFQVKGGH